MPENQLTFKGAGAAAFLEENVFLNKALLDASVDVPFVCLSNNKTERKERLRRVSVNYTLCFLSPFVTLPLTNRLAMKHVAKLTKSFSSKGNNLIHLSNKYLTSKEATKAGIEELAKKYDYKELLESCNYDYEKVRQILLSNSKENKFPQLPKRYLSSGKATKKGIEKFSKRFDFKEILANNNYDYEKIRIALTKAKNAVLSFDFLFSTGSVAGMAFLNNALTKKKTNMDGYSAEFEMADKETVLKRAEKYKKSEPLRKGFTASLVALLTLLPFALRKGMISSKTTGLAGYIKKIAPKFDYTFGKFMKRLPLFLFLTASMTGVALASRNRTEVKNNLILNGTGLAVYFGGDLLINSLLSKASDKFFKTNIIDKSAPKTFLNKIVTPTTPIRNLTGKSKKIASINFFINFVVIALMYGLGVPKMINMIVRKDISKEQKNKLQKININNQIIKQNMMSKPALTLNRI